MSKKTFQYRIYPTRSQEKLLLDVLDACRWVFNKTIEVRKVAWEERRERVSYFDAKKLLPGWKTDHEFLKKAHSQVLQNVSERVELAFQAFFRRVKAGETPGHPRFRSKSRYDSFTFTQHPSGGFKLADDGKLDLSKIGRLKIILHRPIEGTIKTLTIKRTATGKWFAAFACEVDTKTLPANELAIGVDMGIANFAVLSNGEAVANPRFLKTEAKALAQVQRRMSKAEKGTPECRHHRHSAALVYERVANKRKDFSHKLSTSLVQNFGTICMEDLKIVNMVKGHLAKPILDAAWGQFAGFTANKAACAGRSFVTVNPRNTSKMCSRCGSLVEKKLSTRIHDCPSCGLRLDRDHNAAINILRSGLRSLAKEA